MEVATWRGLVTYAVVQITGRYAAEIVALADMTEEIRALEARFDVSAYQPVPSVLSVDDVGGVWLFDSHRAYLQQMVVYKGYRHGQHGADSGEPSEGIDL